MTGEKNRIITQERLWKIDDNQLSTPEHDELVFKLLNKDYVKNVLLKGLLPEVPESEKDWKIVLIESEYPIKSGNYIIGYWDIVIVCESKEGYFRHVFGVECKPSIQSFGQVLRQLNTYSSYRTPYVEFKSVFKIILFTPDIRFKEQFLSQNVIVVSP